jgi:hypothetical protein
VQFLQRNERITESSMDKAMLCGHGYSCVTHERLQQSWLKL